MHQIITIDCEYLNPRFAAAYLLVSNGRAMFIDNNTAHATDKLLAALHAAGLNESAVDFIAITHVHLDHAGGTSKLLAHCPNATVLAHPKAAKRVIDPTKLIEGAKAVYGERKFLSLYGDIQPAPANRVRAVNDEERISFGGRELRFFYTLGHATHHFCIYDEATRAVFTGDSFGLMYPDLQPADGIFIFPSTSPVDFDPDEARASIQKITATGAETAYLTHYGAVTDLAAAAVQLEKHLDAHENILYQGIQLDSLTGNELREFCEVELRAYFDRCFDEGAVKSGFEAKRLLKLDIELNAAGIAWVAEKKRLP